MIRLEVLRGASADWTLQGRLRVVAPNVQAGYDPADVLSADVWTGGDQPALVQPDVAWVDAGSCLFKLSVSDEQTAGLEPGCYQVLVAVVRDGRTAPLLLASLEVLAAPGEGEPARTYCTLQDLLDEAPWIQSVFELGVDQTGFARQRAMAREWFDGLVLAAAPGQVGSSRFPGMLTAGVGGPMQADPEIARILDADGLVLTGPRGRAVVRANACHTLATIFRSQMSDQWAKHAATFRRRATSIVVNLAVELDADGDGVADRVVPLCTAQVHRG